MQNPQQNYQTKFIKWDFFQGCKYGSTFKNQSKLIYHVNKTKHKNYMITSIDAEKAVDKIHHPFMTKALNKVGIEGMYINVTKTVYDKPTANTILSGEKLRAFLLTKGTLLPFLFSIVSEVLPFLFSTLVYYFSQAI